MFGRQRTRHEQISAIEVQNLVVSKPIYVNRLQADYISLPYDPNAEDSAIVPIKERYKFRSAHVLVRGTDPESREPQKGGYSDG